MPDFKIFFRGDSRNPEEIFKNGFDAKEFTDKKQPLPLIRFNPNFFPKYVSISPNFDLANHFPIDHRGKKWIYVLAQDVNQDDGHYINMTERSIAEGDESDELMFFDAGIEEHVVSHISGEKILCAYPIIVEESADTPYLYTFEHPIENEQAKAFLEEENQSSLKSSYQRQLETYLSKIGTKQPFRPLQNNMTDRIKSDSKSIDMTLNEILDEAVHKPLLTSAFYVTQKFGGELKKVPAKPLPPNLEKKKNSAFFDTVQNSDGILFASRRQFEQENLSFFKRTHDSHFDEQIKKEKGSLKILADRSEMGKKVSAFYTSIFQSIKDERLIEKPDPEKEILRTAVSTLKKMFR